MNWQKVQISEGETMGKKFYKSLKVFTAMIILTGVTVWTFYLVGSVERRIGLMKPEKLTVIEGNVISQEDYSVNRSDIVYTDCKNNCLARVRYSKIKLENSPDYYWLNGYVSENLTGKKIKTYYDKDKNIFPKGRTDSFGLFVDNKEVMPVISKRDRDSKSVYVYLMMAVFADITAIGMMLLIKWEDSAFKK